MRLKKIYLLIGLVVIVLSGVFYFGYKYFSLRQNNRNVDVKNNINGDVVVENASVISWDPIQSFLTMKKDDGSEQKYRISLLKTSVLLYENNRETIVMDIKEPRWSSLFCLGDSLSVEFSGGELKRVVNKGPRDCAK